jgi:hypothetical protein
MTNLVDISGIAEIYAQKLHAGGVPTVEALLEKGATVPVGRRSRRPVVSLKRRSPRGSTTPICFALPSPSSDALSVSLRSQAHSKRRSQHRTSCGRASVDRVKAVPV